MSNDRTIGSSGSSDGYDPKVWLHAQDFCDKQSGLCVRVNYSEIPSRYLNGLPLRQYSWELIRVKYNSDKISRYFPIMLQAKNGRVIVDKTEIQTLSYLIDTAESWVQTQGQVREDKIMEARIEREQREANKGQRPGLKQLGKVNR